MFLVAGQVTGSTDMTSDALNFASVKLARPGPRARAGPGASSLSGPRYRKAIYLKASLILSRRTHVVYWCSGGTSRATHADCYKLQFPNVFPFSYPSQSIKILSRCSANNFETRRAWGCRRALQTSTKGLASMKGSPYAAYAYCRMLSLVLFEVIFGTGKTCE